MKHLKMIGSTEQIDVFMLCSRYVYIVLEHESSGGDARVHDVYCERDMAEKARKRIKKTAVGYVSVLKKPIKGFAHNIQVEI